MRNFPENSVKAWADDYRADPFYFVQTSADRTRIIAWSGNPDQVKNAFYALLDHFPFDVEVILKVMLSPEQNEPQWHKYHAEINLSKLTDGICKNESYVFTDGTNQFWVRNPETKEYFAFDDHGVFYIYSDSPTFPELFGSLGFQEKLMSPIYSKPHFHHRPADVKRLERNFVSDLNLEKVASDI
jgi:hypothetical protein